MRGCSKLWRHDMQRKVQETIHLAKIAFLGNLTNNFKLFFIFYYNPICSYMNVHAQRTHTRQTRPIHYNTYIAIKYAVCVQFMFIHF